MSHKRMHDMTEHKDQRFIKRMRAQDYIDKTREYLDYVEEHIENVRLSFLEFNDKCTGSWWIGDDATWHELRHQVERHDLSKLSEQEFVQYRNAFYPVLGDEKAGIDDAWNHHKNANHHHHETAENQIDIFHMIIDWMAMSRKFGDTPRQYYESNKYNIHLSDSHIKLMHEVFDMLEAPSSD